MAKTYLPHSTECFVCGESNKVGLKHIFYVENEFVCCDIFIPDGYNGFKNIVHGGIATAILDETMGWSAYIFGNGKNFYFTRNLQIKFRKSLLIETEYKAVTWFVSEKRSIVTAKGKIIDKNSNVHIEGEGTFVEISDEKMKETAPYMIFHKDKHYHPKIYSRIKELLESN